MPFICSSLVRFIRFIVHPLQREHALVSLLMVLFLSNACITGRPSHHWWYYTMVALFDSYLLALLVDLSAHFSPRRLSVFLRPMLKSIIYFSAFALWTIEIFLFERFHLCISPTVVHLLLETSPAESSEFVEGMFSNNIFWNVLFSTSASGISTPYYQPQRDPLSPKFQPQRRLLRDKIDYDAALQRQKSTEF